MSAGADINATAAAVEAFLATYAGADGLRPVEVRVRPSGDAKEAIKVWLDLGAAGAAADRTAWAAACEAAIRAAVPVGAAQLEVRVETGS